MMQQTLQQATRKSDDFSRMGVGKALAELGSVGLLTGSAFVESAFSLPLTTLDWFFGDRDTKKNGNVVFLLPGFLAPAWAYRGICASLENLFEEGVSVHIPQIGTRVLNINCRSFEGTLDRLDAAYEERKPKAGVGHSLGGILLMALAARHPEFHVCAVGSPVWNTPWKPLQWLARQLLGIDPENLPRHIEELRERILEFPERITTVSSEHDVIAPPHRCWVPEAQNFVVEGGLASLHGGIILSPEVQIHIKHRVRRAINPPIRLIPRRRRTASLC